MIDGYVGRDESIHLRFGIEYHQALQDYDMSRANGVKHEDAIHDTVRALHSRVWDWTPDRSARAGKYKNRESILGLVVDYLDHFADDPAQTVTLDDGKPAVELSFRFELDWGPHAGRQLVYHSTGEAYELDLRPGAINAVDAEGNGLKANYTAQPYLLSGHLDRVVDYQGGLYVMDRKTSMSALGSYFFAQWTPSNQMTLYTLAGKIMLDSPIKGVIIDAAQVLLQKPNNFARGFAYRTPDQLDEYLHDLRYWLNQAEAFATAGYWPQNDTACQKFGGCMFQQVCARSPQVRESYLNAMFTKQEPEDRWNPLRSRG
jgi:hypothetical protein